MRSRAIKTTLNIPWADGGEWAAYSSAKVGDEAQAYARATLIYRAVRLRCNFLTRVPLYFYQGDRIIEEAALGDGAFATTIPMSRLLWLCEASLLLKGAAYVIKLSNMYGKKKGLQWINPFTITSDVVHDPNGFPALRIYQQLPTGERFPRQGWWNPDDYIYLRDYDPRDDLNPGVSAASVALQDAQSIRSVSTFLSNFFTADAMPVTMVMMPEGTADDEVTRMESWFRQKLSGMRHAVSRVLGLTGEVKIEKLTSELRTFDIDKIDAHSLQGISDAFEVPQSLLRSTSGANRAISDNERESFINDTIMPRCKYYEGEFNKYFEEFDQRMEFAPEEMPEMQEDEVQRSSALYGLVNAGVPLMAAFDILGYDLSEEAKRLIEEEQKKKEEQEKQNAERLRVLQEAQANAPGPGQNFGGNGQQPSEEEEMTEEEEEPEEEDEEEDEKKLEIDRWFRKAQNNIKAGKSAVVQFESLLIDDGTRENINTILGAKAWLDEVKVGARHNREDQDKVQKIHDLCGEMGASHERKLVIAHSSGLLQTIHDQSVLLGANCMQEVKSRKYRRHRTDVSMVVDAIKALGTPTVTVTVPEQKAPEVIVNVPPSPAPIVNVSLDGELGDGLIEAMKQIKLQIPDGSVVVNVPEQPPPMINVNVPQQKPPDVFVNVEQKPVDAKVERDAQGRIKRITTEP